MDTTSESNSGAFQPDSGPVPLHHQVYLHLRARLDSGEFRPGERLPPERELTGIYGCSLITVRRALDELARERRIERTPGRGTTVLRPQIERDLAGTMSFTDEMQVRGLDPETKLIAARSRSATEGVAQALEIAVGSEVLYLERLRLALGEPLLLEQMNLPSARFPGLLASDLEHNSLYDLLTERYGTDIVRAREALEPVLLPSREAKLLRQNVRTPALLITGVAFDSDGVPVEYGRSYVRGDRTRYYVERVVVRSGGEGPSGSGRFELVSGKPRK